MSGDWARPVVHWEIESTQPERLRTFYAELFNWDIGDGPIMSIPAGIGGPEPGPNGHIRGSSRNGVNLFVQVRDLRESLDRATSLGGTTIAEPFEPSPAAATLAAILDPDGNAVMLVQQ
jgi:predicted enzyme related to lactoylglutathione lyase